MERWLDCITLRSIILGCSVETLSIEVSQINMKIQFFFGDSAAHLSRCIAKPVRLADHFPGCCGGGKSLVIMPLVLLELIRLFYHCRGGCENNAHKKYYYENICYAEISFATDYSRPELSHAHIK